MKISRTNPVSEDKFIDRLINQMENELLDIWGVTTDEVAFYGRVEKDGDKVFWLDANGKEVDVNSNDKLKFVSYVTTLGNVQFLNQRHSVYAKLVCQGDVKALYPTITHRADAELRKHLQELLFARLDDYTNYEGFDVVDQSENKNAIPFHTFELNFIIKY